MRATLALVGSLLLMFVVGYGISLDVEDLRYAVLDGDQTTLPQWLPRISASVKTPAPACCAA